MSDTYWSLEKECFERLYIIKNGRIAPAWKPFYLTKREEAEYESRMARKKRLMDMFNTEIKLRGIYVKR